MTRIHYKANGAQDPKTPNPLKHKRIILIPSLLVLFGVAVTVGYVAGQKNIFATTSSTQKPTNPTSVDEPLNPKEVNSSVPPTKPDYKMPATPGGLAPVLITIPTKQPVVFLGIDDGANKKPFELQMMKDNNIKASLFLANSFLTSNPLFFKDFIPAGSLIEDHTLTHPVLPNLTYEQQKYEICGEADLFTKLYGRRPELFRPPGGSYNQDTQKAAAACGMKAVVLWVAKANGGSMQYQVGHKLRPGDIVLMHFRPEFQKDMQAFIDAEKAAGLHTELLENWL